MIKLKQNESTPTLGPALSNYTRQTQNSIFSQKQFNYQQYFIESVRESEVSEQKLVQTLNASNLTQNNFSQRIPFQIEKIISQGQRSILYQVNDGQNKMILKRILKGKSELGFLSVLGHPHIVQLIQLVSQQQNQNQIDILLNYMPENLTRFLKNQTKGVPLQNLIIKIFAYQLFRVALYLEKLNIIHNDLKPDNILINSKNLFLQVCDFSDSFMFDKKNNPKQKAVPHQIGVYSAPEIILGSDFYGCSADMWSIGCILAEMILLEPLFEGQNPTDLFLSIVKILGTPFNEDIAEMVPKKSEYSLPKLRKQPLIKFFKHCYPDPKLVDLISQILVYSPSQRVTPLQALLHPYFDQLREKNFQIFDRQFPDFFNFLEQELIESSQEEVDYLVPKWVYDRISDAGSEISPEKFEQMDISDYIAVQSYFKDMETEQELIKMNFK